MMLGCVGNVSLPQETLIRGMTRYSAPTAVVRLGQWGPSACFGRATRAGPPGPGTRANAMGVRGSCRMATWAVRAAVLA